MKTEIQTDNFPDYVTPLPAGHPVRTYFLEATLIRNLLHQLQQTLANMDAQKFLSLFQELCEIEKRFARKENQLFPFLEKHGWTGPSQGMWSFHDAIRDLLRGIRKKLEEHDYQSLTPQATALVADIHHLLLVEEMRLFPNSLQLLSEDEWMEMKAGEEEIGWMIPASHGSPHAPENKSREDSDPGLGKFRLEEGALTPEQVNLVFKFMPVDLTLVDENDRVVFYNRGESRVFPRSAGIIGREVRFCHPPKSVGTVLKILEEFRNGNKNEAEFWIQFKGRIIHIRYFAVRNQAGEYKGVLEMSQDVTEIQQLKGEKRLLDWDETSGK